MVNSVCCMEADLNWQNALLKLLWIVDFCERLVLSEILSFIRHRLNVLFCIVPDLGTVQISFFYSYVFNINIRLVAIGVQMFLIFSNSTIL